MVYKRHNMANFSKNGSINRRLEGRKGSADQQYMTSDQIPFQSKSHMKSEDVKLYDIPFAKKANHRSANIFLVDQNFSY